MTATADMTHLMLRLAAARMDPDVSAEAFVSMLERLVDVAANPSAKPAAQHVERQQQPPEVRRIASPPLNGGSKPRGKTKRYNFKINYDERVRIRMRTDKAREENSGQLPGGFVKAMAAEYLVSEQTIYNILKGEQ